MNVAGTFNENIDSKYRVNNSKIHNSAGKHLSKPIPVMAQSKV